MCEQHADGAACLHAQLPAVLIRICITIVCLPLAWAVTGVVTAGVKPNEPVSGWRRAIIRPWLKFWARVLLHIGFNFWPSVTGEPFAPPLHPIPSEPPKMLSTRSRSVLCNACMAIACICRALDA
jgi:hypothetical protein